jgi:hypothetical protein
MHPFDLVFGFGGSLLLPFRFSVDLSQAVPVPLGVLLSRLGAPLVLGGGILSIPDAAHCFINRRSLAWWHTPIVWHACLVAERF